MRESTKIKLVKNLDVTDLAGDKVMVDFESGKYFMLKGTAADIWNLIQSDTTVENVKIELQKIYDVDDDTCISGIETFLDQLNSNGFVALSE
ncbi:Coenzyme PQQ synthesis protein D (PqqD) [Lachnospiraceae bacterium]|nr:Coenzyme PQQ synthesis protein D (PqqD) [Lachnospiraceae bacterium]